MKPYHTIPIQENHEPLVEIPLEKFSLESPHPYAKLGADYEGHSPYFLRQSVLDALLKAQEDLQQEHFGWKIHLFDAFRPLSVQQFMVDYSFHSLLKQHNLNEADLSPTQREKLWEEVQQFWAIPTSDPTTPPPHSTGAAVDVTLLDETGQLVDMGGEIDELSERSHPDHYKDAQTAPEAFYHQNRQILSNVMKTAGFRQHPYEWWHFSLGDQLWAWLEREAGQEDCVARYGKVVS
ncbi:M15 family metallopeptidase [Spirulina sp. CS-785/01]|uniref:M15 family metallopeptidase n=1 Tax=Spirulina sp. CS-785/01 TaxID=3021716 RepID=UPI00232FD87B|nr:M15 family metallopeptidase [Spirulina sp. CS-785/01]MDB9313412.1 M15 family metallopeptidase [Spirulina sp. CS-785/01]